MSLTRWDPFVGEVFVPRSRRSQPEGGHRNTAFLQGLLVMVSLAGLLWTLVQLVIGDTAGRLIGVAIFIAPFLPLALLSSRGRDSDWIDWILQEAGGRNGWDVQHLPGRDDAALDALMAAPHRASFDGAPLEPAPDGPRESPAALWERRLGTMRARIGPLLAARPGLMLPLDPRAFYYGTARNGMPFWMGVEVVDVMLLLAPRAMRRDRYGNRAWTGRGLGFVIAYRLDRDTGIAARLMAEAGGRDARRDIDTESIAFNRAFHVTLDTDDGQNRARLLQVLTPAFQHRLLELHETFRIQLIVHGRDVFLRGFEIANLRDPDRVAALFAETVAALADAAEGFKHYAE